MNQPCDNPPPGTHRVDDLDLPALDVYRHLKDRHLKCRQGLFIAEGLEVVRRLLLSSYRVHSVLLTPEKLERLAPDLPAGVAVYLATVKQMQDLAGFTIHRGALACGVRPAPRSLDEVIAVGDAARLMVVLENICDAQNVGVIVRNAAAFGAGLVVLSGCCDPYYRRAVRVSMGNVFRVPLYVTDRLADDLQAFRERLGVELVAAELSAAATPLGAAPRASRVALLFGAEGEGLTAETLRLCDHRVVVPMATGTDSVNVAVASGIFLYAYSASTTAASALTGWASTSRVAARR